MCQLIGVDGFNCKGSMFTVSAFDDLVPGLMLILVSLGHRAAGLSSQMNQYIFCNMQIDLVVA